jgi:preprotein translocase subunit SecA
MNIIPKSKIQYKLLTKIKDIFNHAQGSSVECDLSPYRKVLAQMEKYNFKNLTDDKLKKHATSLLFQASAGTLLDKLMAEAFALVREVSIRVTGMRPFNVQVIAGLAIHQGKLAQMQTGEGKTLAAVMPAYLNALPGKGIHILTANDYLAQRDAEWMGPIYNFLGLTVSFIKEGMENKLRKKAYAADITYLTAREAGFDYLRDQLCFKKEKQVQRPFHYAIVDEADFILIDEARVPLVIAGNAPKTNIDMKRMAEVAQVLEENIDYSTDENLRNVMLTEVGINKVESILNCGSLYDPKNLLIHASINVALHAEVLLHRDKDYIVREGNIELVDEFTGRVADKRRWPHGIQSAIEAKEGLKIQPEGQIYGSITLQHFLNLYPKISGMTATAVPAAEELKDFYGMNIVVIPQNKACIRHNEPDLVFTHKEAKFKALVEEITRVHDLARPILVGTSSVAESEKLALLLKQTGVECQVLNAKNDAQEAKIVSGAGAYKAVTISTNMAGRGTDIRLGGENEEFRREVLALGGLYVIGTNRHESRRIDNQLQGRAGRQGDPGSSRFFISLEDDLMERYGLRKLLPAKYYVNKQDQPIEDPIVRREIARAQRIIEGQNFEIRKTLHSYSNIVEIQRQIIQKWRQEVLHDGYPSSLEKKNGRKYSNSVTGFGKEVIRKVEKQLTLFTIDQCWSEHLAHIADIREGIHLHRLASKSPLIEFQRAVDRAFTDMQEQIEKQVIKGFKRVNITKEGIDFEKEGLKRPSSTWTYMINDNPFSKSELMLFFKRIFGYLHFQL